MKKLAMASWAMIFGLIFSGIAAAQQSSGTDSMGGVIMGDNATKHEGRDGENEISRIPGAVYKARNTKDGVVLTITAKDPAAVKIIQESARKIAAVKNASANPDEIMACPVLGTKFWKSKAYDATVYKGKTYYFCCAGCKPVFLKNPEHYVK